MGIQSRDYMRQPPDDDPGGGGDGRREASSPTNAVEAFIRGLLRRHPRFFKLLGLSILVLVAAAVIVVKLSDAKR